MRRREFITLLGGAAAAWPVAAHAQQARKLPTIGFLGAATLSSASQWVTAFEKRLRELDWIEGRTVAIEYRWAEGRSERFAEIAAEFVRLKVDVIVTWAAAPVIAAMQATMVIPIVFAAQTDPVGAGIVTSLARPSGNVTGLSNQQTDTVGKRLDLLREVVQSSPVGDRGQRRRSRCRAGEPAHSASKSSHSKSNKRRISRPPLRRSRAARTHFMSRPTRSYSPIAFESTHLGTGCATADDLREPGIHRRGRSNVLWTKLSGPVQARGRLGR